MEITEVQALLGGVLFGAAASAVWWFEGRLAGVSGFLRDLVRGEDARWHAAFFGGMIAAALLVAPFGGLTGVGAAGKPLLLVVLSAFLVGLGARLANGCTSGHGICGVGRLSVRSIASCALFLVCGMLAGAALRLGGAS